jgi:hypothetical protein
MRKSRLIGAIIPISIPIGIFGFFLVASSLEWSEGLLSTSFVVHAHDYYLDSVSHPSEHGRAINKYSFTVYYGTIKFCILSPQNYYDFLEGEYQPAWKEEEHLDSGLGTLAFYNACFLFYNDDSYDKYVDLQVSRIWPSNDEGLFSGITLIIISVGLPIVLYGEFKPRTHAHRR